MNFTELKTELFARGTDYLEEDSDGIARAERWLNQAYREILNLQAWPFLQAVATGDPGVGFVNIPDLRKVRYVRDLDTGLTLARTTMDELADDNADFDQTGTPDYYYVETGTSIKAWPVGGTLEVHYTKRVSPMTGTDEPLFLEEYHNLIVDRAMMKAHIDNDNYDVAAALKQEYDAGVSSMAEDYQLVSKEVTYIDPGDPYDG